MPRNAPKGQHKTKDKQRHRGGAPGRSPKKNTTTAPPAAADHNNGTAAAPGAAPNGPAATPAPQLERQRNGKEMDNTNIMIGGKAY